VYRQLFAAPGQLKERVVIIPPTEPTVTIGSASKIVSVPGGILWRNVEMFALPWWQSGYGSHQEASSSTRARNFAGAEEKSFIAATMASRTAACSASDVRTAAQSRNSMASGLCIAYYQVL
jgi:hypothetical protein